VNEDGAGKRLGIDVGGTYTDLVLLDESGVPVSLKVPSVPGDPARGVLDGIDALGVDVSELEMIVHGSTIGVNAIIQGTGARTGLLTTAGFEDVLEIGTQSKPEMYNLLYRKPRPLVAREHRLGVDERMTFEGEVLRAPDAEEIVAKVQELVDDGLSSLAISTLHSYANPASEAAIKATVAERFPELTLSVSSEIANQRREYERTSTTVVNAYIAPPVAAYLNQLLERVQERGFHGPVFIMRSNGGVMSAQLAREVPVHTLLSGPVAGSIAGRIIGASTDTPNVITFDMGGTSCDVSVILDGDPSQSFEADVEGHPVMTPLVDIDYIGAGGGSIAKVVGDRSLRVGPESAGAVPGPACYGKGGTEPTVSDANVLLGRLDPEGTLAGGIPLRPDLAETAIREHLAEPLEMSLQEAALGVIDIANVKMAYAIRAVTVEQGLDPRDFALIAFGGAGPLHAPLIAQIVGISRVIVPWSPGTICAWGMVNTDLRHDVVRTVDYGGRTLAVEEVAALFAQLEDEGAQALVDQGVHVGDIATRRAIDMRYGGQEHTLTIGLPEGPLSSGALETLRASFDDTHQRRYAHSSPDEGVEFVNVRVEAIGRLRKPAAAAASTSAPREPAPRGTRPVVFAQGTSETPVYTRSELDPGARIDGPAVIEEDGSSSLLPPGFSLVVDGARNLLIDVPEGQLV
jgi:N-methylhydantoinase A